MPTINRMNSGDADFHARLEKMLTWEGEAGESVERRVREIVEAVRRRGDAAVVEYTNHLDRRTVKDAADLVLGEAELARAQARIASHQHSALCEAARRIQSYHEKQKSGSWTYEEADGTCLGQQVTPLDRVGLYVPGGKAAYPSSVLMNAIPAKVAGVSEVVMVVPAPDDEVDDLVLAAASIAGVGKVITIGGAQAVAALAYGTETVPAVDKIVGPGNIYVATAKRMVFGKVGIDMIAGPSEILILTDGGIRPDWVAMDLFSQAEHDEDARAMLIATDAAFLRQVENEIARLLPTMERAEIIAKSLANGGALIEVQDLDDGIDVVNFIAPEHLELALRNPEAWAGKVRHAGAIFMGYHSCEALGDYCAGPNHVLPTARTARFSSPLGVYDFEKRSSLIRCTPAGAHALGAVASTLARGEGLTAHARSAELRMAGEAAS